MAVQATIRQCTQRISRRSSRSTSHERLLVLVRQPEPVSCGAGNPLGIPLPESSLEPTPNRSRRWPLAAYRDGDSGSPCGRDRRFRVG